MAVEVSTSVANEIQFVKKIDNQQLRKAADKSADDQDRADLRSVDRDEDQKRSDEAARRGGVDIKV